MAQTLCIQSSLDKPFALLANYKWRPACSRVPIEHRVAGPHAFQSRP